MQFKSLLKLQRKERTTFWLKVTVVSLALFLFALAIEGVAVFDWLLLKPWEETRIYQAAAARVVLMVAPFIVVICYLAKKIVLLMGQVMQDPLTGLASETCLKVQAPQMLAAEIRQFSDDVKSGKVSAGKVPTISVCFFDLDGLKTINDTWGHDHGNEAIKILGHALRLTFNRGSDFVARVGGDEFVAITYHRDDALMHELQRKFNKNLRQVCDTTMSVCGYKIAASMGQCHGRITDEDILKRLLREADAAMYEQKCARKAAR